jgi:hypothetical protein
VIAQRQSIRVKFALAIAQARGPDIERAGTFVFALAFRHRRTAMPAGTRRKRERSVSGVTARLIAREIDHDILFGRYNFFNHCCPRGLKARVIAERFRSIVQRNAQILAEKLRQRVYTAAACLGTSSLPDLIRQSACFAIIFTKVMDTRGRDLSRTNAYNHRFHLKNTYGSTAAITIMINASG